MSQVSVYVIASDAGPVKVGIAKDPEQRMETLQTGSPYRLSLIHAEVAPDFAAREAETYAHSRIASNRLIGEWFDCSRWHAIDAVREAVAAVRSGWRPIVRPEEAVVVRVPMPLRRRLEAIAAKKRRSVSTYVEELVASHVAQHGGVMAESQPGLLLA